MYVPIREHISCNKGLFMIKVMLIFGTRPEAIKLCPLIQELKKRKNIETGTAVQTVVCVTGQHREMLDQVLDVFHIGA